MAASRLAQGHLWSRRATSMALISLGAGRRGTTRVTWAPSTPSLATGPRSRPTLTVPGTCQLLSVPMLSVPLLSVPTLCVPTLSSCSDTATTRGILCRHSLLLVCLAYLTHTTSQASLPIPNAVQCMFIVLSKEVITPNILHYTCATKHTALYMC